MEKTNVIEFPKAIEFPEATKPNCGECFLSESYCKKIPTPVLTQLCINGCCIPDKNTLRTLCDSLRDYSDSKSVELFLLHIDEAVGKFFAEAMVLAPTVLLVCLNNMSSFNFEEIFAGILLDTLFTLILLKEMLKNIRSSKAKFQKQLEILKEDQRNVEGVLENIGLEYPELSGPSKVKKIGTK